jgi:hypothetical protein
MRYVNWILIYSMRVTVVLVVPVPLRNTRVAISFNSISSDEITFPLLLISFSANQSSEILYNVPILGT